MKLYVIMLLLIGNLSIWSGIWTGMHGSIPWLQLWGVAVCVALLFWAGKERSE